MFRYRAYMRPGRTSLVGTTIKDPVKLPEHVIVDEKHPRLNGNGLSFPRPWHKTVFWVHKRRFLVMNFPGDDLVFKYVSNLATIDEQVQVDACMAQSEVFLRRVEVFAFLKSKFGTLCDSWSAEQHERVYQLWTQMRSLNRAIESQPRIAETAQRYIEALWKGTKEIAVNLVLDTEKHLTTIASVYLPPGYASHIAWAGVGDSGGAAREHRQRSNEFLSMGKVKEAVGELEEVARIDRVAAQEASWQLLHDGTTKMEIQISSRQKRISVKYWPREGETPPSSIFLMPLEGSEIPSMAEFETVSEGSYLLAEFEVVSSGQYKLFCQSSDS